MSHKILTHSVADIEVFMKNPCNVLNKAESGTVAIFVDNTPMFYAITSERLTKLLDLEKTYLANPTSDIMLDAELFEELSFQSSTVPMGKFAMYHGWQPDKDFQFKAALWGINLTYSITPQELTAFVSWWQAEGRIFTHIQWQQKLARSIQIFRANSNKQPRDINTFSQPDVQIPQGFRGAK